MVSSSVKRSCAYFAPFAVTLGLIAILAPSVQAGPVPKDVSSIAAAALSVRSFWSSLWHDALGVDYWFFHKTSQIAESNIVGSCIGGVLDALFSDFAGLIPCGLSLGVTVINGAIAALIKYEIDRENSSGSSKRSEDNNYSQVGDAYFWYGHQDLDFLQLTIDEVLGNLKNSVSYSAVVSSSSNYTESKRKRADSHDDVLYFFTLNHGNATISVSTMGGDLKAALKTFADFSNDEPSNTKRADSGTSSFVSFTQYSFNPEYASDYLQSVNTTSPEIIKKTKGSIWGQESASAGTFWLKDKACIALAKSLSEKQNPVISGELFFNSFGSLDSACEV